MTPSEITEKCKELRELESKATPGPWDKIVKMGGFTAIGANALIARVFSPTFRDEETERANAELIAVMRNNLPDILEALEGAQAQAAEWKAKFTRLAESIE